MGSENSPTMVRTSSRGLTLGEIIVALGIASLAILTLAVYVSTVHRAAAEGKSQAGASTLARRVMERLRSDRAWFLAVQAAPEGFDEDQMVWQPDEVVPVRYRVETRLQPLASAPQGYLDATVTVTWLENHRQRRVVLETYLTAP